MDAPHDLDEQAGRVGGEGPEGFSAGPTGEGGEESSGSGPSTMDRAKVSRTMDTYRSAVGKDEPPATVDRDPQLIAMMAATLSSTPPHLSARAAVGMSLLILDELDAVLAKKAAS